MGHPEVEAERPIRAREVRGATWSPNPALTHELPTSHDCARASTRNGQRAHTLHSAYYGQIARTWRRGGAHTRRARAHIVGRCAAATRQPRTTGQSQGGRARHQKIGRSPTRDTSHYGRAGGRRRRASRRPARRAQCSVGGSARETITNSARRELRIGYKESETKPTDVFVSKKCGHLHGPGETRGHTLLHTDPGLAGVRRGVTRRAPL